MREQVKYKIGTIILGATLLGLSILCLIKPQEEYSNSERRKLETLPKWSIHSWMNKNFSQGFDNYTMDQYPYRDIFRRVKAYGQYDLFRQKDNNGIYMVNGYAAKLIYPLNEAAIRNATDKFEDIYMRYLKDKNLNIYCSVIPDKGYYLASRYGYPSMDYRKMFRLVKEGMPYAHYIDISKHLQLEDYYQTDTHWRQECLLPVVNKIAKEMGFIEYLSSNYITKTGKNKFYGVYYGQSALPLASEKINYLTNNAIEQCTVYNYETNQNTKVYDLSKLSGKDPYEMFLSGAAPILSISNPNASSRRELIMFRDSFGSSLAPLIIEGYSKITLVDIRYVDSSYLKEYIDFNNQDVLFMYSSLVLNNSYMLK